MSPVGVTFPGNFGAQLANPTADMEPRCSQGSTHTWGIGLAAATLSRDDAKPPGKRF